jgi:hypothetical protein
MQLLVPWQNVVIFHLGVHGWFEQIQTNEDKFHQLANNIKDTYCHSPQKPISCLHLTTN